MSVLHYVQSHGIRIAPVFTLVQAVHANMLCFALSPLRRIAWRYSSRVCQCNHADASAHIWWDAAGVVPLLLKILTAASKESGDSCVVSACQHLLPGCMARRACQCLALLSVQDVFCRAAIARMKGVTVLSQLLGRVSIFSR